MVSGVHQENKQASSEVWGICDRKAVINGISGLLGHAVCVFDDIVQLRPYREQPAQP